MILNSNFHPDSKVWIYQSSREFSSSELNEIEQLGNSFVSEWAAHGAKLKAGFEIRYNRFIIIIADESQAMASGCSIDKSVSLIRHIENTYNLNLLDRMSIAYKSDEQVLTLHLNDFEAQLKSGILSSETIVFNNLVQTLDEFTHQWEIPVKESWHKMLV
jgi:hypothetical protein